MPPIIGVLKLGLGFDSVPFKTTLRKNRFKISEGLSEADRIFIIPDPKQITAEGFNIDRRAYSVIKLQRFKRPSFKVWIVTNQEAPINCWSLSTIKELIPTSSGGKILLGGASMPLKEFIDNSKPSLENIQRQGRVVRGTPCKELLEQGAILHHQFFDCSSQESINDWCKDFDDGSDKLNNDLKGIIIHGHRSVGKSAALQDRRRWKVIDIETGRMCSGPHGNMQQIPKPYIMDHSSLIDEGFYNVKYDKSLAKFDFEEEFWALGTSKRSYKDYADYIKDYYRNVAAPFLRKYPLIEKDCWKPNEVLRYEAEQEELLLLI